MEQSNQQMIKREIIIALFAIMTIIKHKIIINNLTIIIM